MREHRITIYHDGSHQNLPNMLADVEALASLKHAIGYLEDAVHLLRDSHNTLETELEYEGCFDIDADTIITMKRAENAVESGLRFAEKFKELGGLTQ